MTVLSFPGSFSPVRAPIAVPDVVGKDVDEARDILERQLGLRVRVESVIGLGDKDKVFSQRPAAGSTATSNTVVTLKVFATPPGQTPPEVLKALEDLKTDLTAVKGDTASIAQLATDTAAIKADVDTVKTEVAAVKTEVTGVKTDVAGVKTDTETLRADVAAVKADTEAIAAVVVPSGTTP